MRERLRHHPGTRNRWSILAYMHQADLARTRLVPCQTAASPQRRSHTHLFRERELQDEVLLEITAAWRLSGDAHRRVSSAPVRRSHRPAPRGKLGRRGNRGDRRIEVVRFWARSAMPRRRCGVYVLWLVSGLFRHYDIACYFCQDFCSLSSVTNTGAGQKQGRYLFTLSRPAAQTSLPGLPISFANQPPQPTSNTSMTCATTTPSISSLEAAISFPVSGKPATCVSQS